MANTNNNNIHNTDDISSSITANIESENLAAHVLVCTIRYNNLDEKLDSVDNKVTSLENTINGLKTTIEAKETQSSNRIIGWGISIIGVLLTVVGTLLYHFVITK